MILDFSESLTNSSRAIMGSATSPDDPELFYSRRGWCRFCQVEIPIVHEAQFPWDSDELLHKSDIWECQTCGWWEVYTRYNDNEIAWWDLRHAILRRFESTDATLPLDTLVSHLDRHPDLLNEASPRMIEELVAHIFRGHFECDVVHCGRTGDGGIDLVVVVADDPILVQVKRRTRKTAVEPVALVRELLGATLLVGGRRAAFVTTGKGFSRQAQDAAARAITLGLVTSFELFDAASLLAIFQLQRVWGQDAHRPWHRFREGHNP